MRRVMLVLSVDAHGVERGFRSASRSAGHFERDISRAGRGVIAATVGFKGLGRSLALASGTFVGVASITAGIKSAVNAGVEYESSLHKITALTGVAAAQTAKFGEELLALSPKVGKAPKELADALYFIASAGFRGAAALKVLRASAQASASGLGETKVVADAVTSAVNSYGKTSLTASSAVDTLIAAVREGKTEASALAPVLGNVLPVAAKLGVSFQDVGAAMAAMTRSGFDAATASTNLTAVFSTLLKDTPKTEKSLKAVGLSAAGLRTEMKQKGLLAALGTLQMAFKGNVGAMAQAFPNIRALRAVLSLTGTSAAQTAKIFSVLRNSTGALRRAFQITQRDPAFRFEKLKAGLADVKIRLGSALLPQVLKVTDRFGAWLSVTKNQKTLSSALARVIEQVASAMGRLADAAKAVTGAVGGWKNAITIAVGAWAGFKAGAVGAAVAASAANVIAAGVTGAAWKAALISTGFGALAVVAGIAAAYIVTHWSKVKRWFGVFWKYTKAVGKATFEAIKQLARAYVYVVLNMATIAIRGILEVASHLPFVGDSAKRALKSINSFIDSWKPDLRLRKVTAAFAKAGEDAGQSWADNLVYTMQQNMPRIAAVGSAAADAAASPQRQGRQAPDRGVIPASQRVKYPRVTGYDPRTGAPRYGPATAPGTPTAATSASGEPKWKKAMNVALDRFNISLDRAGWTKTLKDDMAVVKEIIAYLQRQHSLHKKDLDVEKDLVQYQGQLLSLNHDQKDALKQQTDAVKQQIDTVKQQIGTLFQGPVLAPTDAQTKARLGVLGPDPHVLLRDLRGQVSGFKEFMGALLALRKRGAPADMLKELRGLGPDATIQIKALASAPKRLLKQYIAAFSQRNREAIQAANVNLSARSVVIRTGKVTSVSHDLRKMGSGGIVTGPTRALIGESGPEAVIPLSRMRGGGGQVVVPVYLDGRMITKVVVPNAQRLDRQMPQQSRGRYPGYSAYGT